jgi:hypothetical protein
MKKLFQSPFFKNILLPLVRGVVKQVPIIGTPISEIVTNITQVATADKTEGAPKIELKHKWMSIAVQVCVAGFVFYGLYTHQITLEQILGWLNIDLSSPVATTP